MKEDQKYIFFASGESLDKIDKLPQTELLKDKGYEILYLTDNIDEFALQVLHAYNEKEFKSVSADDLDPVSYTHLGCSHDRSGGGDHKEKQ